MKVSIITVCFNSGETIRDTIESVLAQSHTGIEHIIVDGASKDDTLEIVDEYRSSLGPIISEPDQGLYDAMNKGIETASGDIVGVLNSDDFYEDKEVIEKVVNSFKVSPTPDMVFGDVVFVRPDDLTTVSRHYRAAHFHPWKLRFGWMPPHPATFVRKELYEAAGKYRQDMKIAADYEMFVRWLLVSKCSYAYIDKVLVRMRSGGVSTSGVESSLLLNQEIVKACRVNGIYTNLLFVLTKIPFKLLELAGKRAGSRH
ncbi:glycosyltransferase family 2 protein [Salicola sp. Rm-C-2C1-2]|uniref:glycosyltransferase family 2 protein n=1 Tax=Salicola sp. Rm-C-2C1-2 TaxID=3141321 RepID=UPI0032E4DD0C